MNWFFVDESFLKNTIHAFCWMLIHSVWQGLLLMVVTGVILMLTKKVSPAVRYNIVGSLFILFLIACCFTFFHEWNNDDAITTPTIGGIAFAVTSVLQDYGMDHFPYVWIAFCNGNAFIIVSVWLTIFCLKCYRMNRALKFIHSFRTNDCHEPGVYWKNKIDGLSLHMKIRKTVKLLESGITKVPVVIGHLKPVIYVPIGLIAKLPADQVEAVLLHELAHIRRNDYLFNLLQNIGEYVFFFNPGLLWMSSVLKQEREHCCDDIVLSHTGNKKQLIRALIGFKEYAASGTAYATAFPGRSNHLMQRVTRIIKSRNNSLNGPELLFFFFSLFILAGLGAISGIGKIPGSGSVPVVEKYVFESNPGEDNTIPAIKSMEDAEVKKIGLKKSKKELNPPVVKHQKIKIGVIEPNEKLKLLIKDRKRNAENRKFSEANRQLYWHQQAMLEHLQAELEREQGSKHIEQAKLEKFQAEKDRALAEYDRIQAELIRLQAELR